jgi:O-succinylbenzoate synthase
MSEILRLQYRRYRLPFRAPVRTAHGVWTHREGLLVRLAGEGGAIGYGEAAPLPGFGSESVDEDEEALRRLGEWTTKEAVAAVPARLGCLRNALATAREFSAAPGDAGGTALGVAALLPAGRAALPEIARRGEGGFRVFKWKVGVGDAADELALLDDVCAGLPNGGRLRLDANGAWDRRQAERWLERCAERPIEFIEQPCFPAVSAGAAAQRKAEDLLLGLAGEYPTPIALDESVANEAELDRWLALGWPGFFVIKPSLLGDLRAVLARLERAKARVVFSSALETVVGARAALRTVFSWCDRPEGASAMNAEPGGGGAARVVGFGVYPIFEDARFDGPRAAPFLRREDVEALKVEAAWNALG